MYDCVFLHTVVYINVGQVSLEWVLIGYIQFIMRSVLNLKRTDLIINWIYPIKTHSSETWGKSNLCIADVQCCTIYIKKNKNCK